ncbi:hypothetical protein [Streptomyces sp. NPDC097619]|uniref:hypothetical protein n=1 Tax=Streptomyces sp. NPDC097619 TaxID=3157228 RepID=UPI003330E58C
MRDRNAFALRAVLAVFLVVSVFTLGLLTPTLRSVEVSTAPVSAASTGTGWHDLAPQAHADAEDGARTPRHRGSGADDSEVPPPPPTSVIALPVAERPALAPACFRAVSVTEPAVDQVRRC